MQPSRFIAFHAIPESQASQTLAPTFALTLARGPDGVVLVFNRFRQVWELPGGLIDPGESAREAARRELAEEAHCDGEALEWLGVVEVEDKGRRCGAVFGCTVATVPAHVANDEMAGITAWTRSSPVQPLGPTDRVLLERLG
jgi:8-oxo-dGTP diphosphatase